MKLPLCIKPPLWMRPGVRVWQLFHAGTVVLTKHPTGPREGGRHTARVRIQFGSTIRATRERR